MRGKRWKFRHLNYRLVLDHHPTCDEVLPAAKMCLPVLVVGHLRDIVRLAHKRMHSVRGDHHQMVERPARLHLLREHDLIGDREGIPSLHWPTLESQ
jgi:hypothetical protein